MVVDLGFGYSPVTTVELFGRLRVIRPDVEVIGLEIDLSRVVAALPLERPGLSFRHGGFEVLPGAPATIVRASNVLRQYDEDEVEPAWRRLAGALAPGGLVVDGTCDEIGRRHAWIEIGPEGPRSLTVSVHLRTLPMPSAIAERLPKALIHHNVPGEAVHDLFRAWDDAWERCAPHGSFGRRQRFLASIRELRRRGIPVLGGPARWRLGEVSFPWEVVAPKGMSIGESAQRTRSTVR